MIPRRWDIAVAPILTAAILLWNRSDLIWILVCVAFALPPLLDDSEDSSDLPLPLFLAMMSVLAALLLPPDALLLWFLVPFATAACAWRRVDRLVGNPESPVTSRVTQFCISGLSTPGLALLVLVFTLNTPSRTAENPVRDLGELATLSGSEWAASPELLRGLVAIGAVLLATGLTLWVIFDRRERLRRERVAVRYRRRSGSLERRLARQIDIVRRIRSEASQVRVEDTPIPESEAQREHRVGDRQRDVIRGILSTRSLEDVMRVEHDLQSTGALSLATHGPIELPENIRLVRQFDPLVEPLRMSLEHHRDAVLSLAGDSGSIISPEVHDEVTRDSHGHRLDLLRLLAEEDDLASCQEAFRSIAEVDEEDFARRSLAEHLARERLGVELRDERIEQQRPARNARQHRHLVAGFMTLVPLPLVMSFLAATPSGLDARWLDTILSVCAVVGTALLTLYAVLREASLDAIEGTIEAAIESAGRITVLSGALERILERPIASFATQHYVEEDDLRVSVETEDVLATVLFHPPQFTGTIERLLDWASQREPSEATDVLFIPRARLPAAEAGASSRVRRARVLRFEIEPEASTEPAAGLSAEYWASAARAIWRSDVRSTPASFSEDHPLSALHLILACEGELREDAGWSRDSLLALAFEPDGALEWEPWKRLPAIRPAVLVVPHDDGLLKPSLGVIEIDPTGRGGITESREERATRLMDAIRREAEELELRGLLDTVRSIEETIQPADGTTESIAGSARDDLKQIRKVLLGFQDRNLFPLERFIGDEGTITSEADVLEFVLSRTTSLVVP